MLKQNPSTTGDITELMVMTELAKCGWYVFKPMSGSCHIDIIGLDLRSNTHKIQIKTAERTKLGFALTITKPSSGSVYADYEVDYFATVFEGKLYMIPHSVVSNKKYVSFRVDYHVSDCYDAAPFEMKDRREDNVESGQDDRSVSLSPVVEAYKLESSNYGIDLHKGCVPVE